MSEDRSLDAFSSDAAASNGDESIEGSTVEPPTISYRSRPDGFVCAECGNETPTEWLDDGAFVCPDCKSWA